MNAGAPPAAPTQRVDKWLWVARLFKTRSSAAAAVSGGKVHVDGERVKPSRRIGPGVTLEVRRDTRTLVVVVEGVASNRLPARDAVGLYTETEASIARRAAEAEQRRARNEGRARGLGRPTKRDRRELERVRGARDRDADD